MVTHGSISNFRFTGLLWKVLELMIYRDDRGEKGTTQHLQCLAGYQSGCDRGRARFGLTEISEFWAYTPPCSQISGLIITRQKLSTYEPKAAGEAASFCLSRNLLD
jgi:hypothetical protein